jgi:hypothetical protein
MSIENRPSDKPESKFAFGDSEVDRAKQAQAIAKRVAEELRSNPTAAVQAAGECQGFDPYNSSGSFDRKKHWERVGKR